MTHHSTLIGSKKAIAKIAKTNALPESTFASNFYFLPANQLYISRSRMCCEPAFYSRSPSCSAHNEKHKIRAHIKIAHKNKLFYSSSLLEPPNALYGRSLSSSLTRFLSLFCSIYVWRKNLMPHTYKQSRDARSLFSLGQW